MTFSTWPNEYNFSPMVSDLSTGSRCNNGTRYGCNLMGWDNCERRSGKRIE